jgi:predicted RNA binding protein YcfA (HicA-like mRNA interferase family)
MKIREVIRLLEANGWRLDRTHESHRQYKHPENPNVVTVPGKESDDIPVGTLHNILRKSGLEEVS